jgi:biofilm protein TabA
MILDALTNAARYDQLNPRFGAACQLLAKTDWTTWANGRHELPALGLVVMVNRYVPKEIVQLVPESHRAYIDIQYMVFGEEWLGWTNLEQLLAVTTPYDANRDITFYGPVVNSGFVLRAGQMAIFFPEDVHAPGGQVPGSLSTEQILKVVVKVPVLT